MIFRIEFSEKTEYAEAQNKEHLEQEYENEYGDDVNDILSIEIIDDETAKTIMLTSNEPDLIGEFSLFDSCDNDGFFKIVGSTDWY